IAVRCSCGVAELAPEMISPQDLYQAADAALLVAKRSGRNRVKVRSGSHRATGAAAAGGG
ncbi:MAG TPA: hypothetical protein VHB47_11820, partial [Thermoanaerobaculia bacterium]|nr:hypothetical protein [Thermoanaerobaculia bacterium]